MSIPSSIAIHNLAGLTQRLRADRTTCFPRFEEHGAMRLTDLSMNSESTTVYGSPHPRVRLLVADDHEVMRLGIRNLVEIKPGWSVCAEANNGREAIEKALQYHPDVIIMDLSMPIMNGLEAASQIAEKEPEIPVILFSLHVGGNLSHHFHAKGIRGAVAKGDAARDLILAVETVLAGGTFFTDQKPDSRLLGSNLNLPG
jgi:CheY-like chemotaxis protein